MKHDTPAFPISPEIWETHPDFHGLTKREWFAGMALQGMCSAPGGSIHAPEMARFSFVLADAMIAASAKGIDDGR